jgi:transposase
MLKYHRFNCVAWRGVRQWPLSRANFLRAFAIACCCFGLIVAAFRAESPHYQLAVLLYDRGLANKQIAKEMKLHRSQVTMLLQHWSELHGEQLPDGRSRRWTLPQNAEDSPEYQRIADEAVALMRKGYSDCKVGRQLGCSGTTVGHAIAWWHTNRGLPVPTMEDRRIARALFAKSLRDDGLPIDEVKQILECSTTTLYRLFGIADGEREESGPGDPASNEAVPKESLSEDVGESGL